jgi:hypothetical protein
MVFQIIIGENCNAAMYNHMRSVGHASCVYFIVLVVGGNVIMLNLFLAILLGNFDRARESGEKKKIFSAIESLTKDGYDLNIAIAYLFDDAEFMKYIEDKVLAAGNTESEREKGGSNIDKEEINSAKGESAINVIDEDAEGTARKEEQEE